MTTTTDTETPAQAVVRAAAGLLATEHSPAVRNDYGACTRPGYAVTESTQGLARIHHQLPNLKLSDPNRLSSSQRWAECRDRVHEYATTLEAAGWTVERKTVTTGAILIASPPPLVDEVNETLWRAVNLLRTVGQTVMPLPVAGPLADMLETAIGEEHGPRPQEDVSPCYGCGGTGERYDGTGPDGHIWSGVECCCSHPHCVCGECGAFPCDTVRNALAVARGMLALKSEESQ